MHQDYIIGAYYFPNYHRDPRNDVWMGEGWTEGSYLLPDTDDGNAYLDGMREVFGPVEETEHE